MLDHDQLLYIEILEGLRSVRMNATVNTYAPLHTTSLGKAILSKLDTEEVDADPRAKAVGQTDGQTQ